MPLSIFDQFSVQMPDPYPDLDTCLRIYRKTVSNLKIREKILNAIRSASDYKIGPTIICTSDPDNVKLFTVDEDYTNFIGFERNPIDGKKMKTMKKTKGTILIQDENPGDAMNIPVHFCGYRVDEKGNLEIFDPSWHSKDRGDYSTTLFYDSLDAFGVAFKHFFEKRPRHWQSLLQQDVFCQTWSLKWLSIRDDGEDLHKFYPPVKTADAIKQLTNYIKTFAKIISDKIDFYTSEFCSRHACKLEGNNIKTVFDNIIQTEDSRFQKEFKTLFA
jgi:hypothetical protein